MCTVVAELEGMLVPKLLKLKGCYHKLKILKMEFAWYGICLNQSQPLSAQSFLALSPSSLSE